MDCVVEVACTSTSWFQLKVAGAPEPVRSNEDGDGVVRVGTELQQFVVTAQAVPVVFNTAPLPTQATVLLVTLK